MVCKPKRSSAISAVLGIVWPVATVAGGCAGRTPVDWHTVAAAEPTPITHRWRARLPVGQRLSPQVAVELGQEYDLVVVTGQSGWQRLWRELGKADAPTAPDFADGAVVGLVARIGEPVSHRWPVHVDQVRVVDGYGVIDTQLNSGVYYPVIGPSYVELVHVVALRHVVMIRIGQERFLFGEEGEEQE